MSDKTCAYTPSVSVLDACPTNSLTLGGFLTEKLQHLPKKGERVLYEHYYFQVQKATPKRVLQALIFRDKPSNRSAALPEDEITS